MLLYHPLYDAHHCAYRLIMIYRDIDKDKLQWELLKILDFYLLFPHFLQDIKLPQELTSRRPELRRINKPYESLPSPNRLLFQLGEIQDQTAKSLAAKGIVEKESFVQGKIKIRNEMIDKNLVQTFEKEPLREKNWYSFLVKELALIPVFGANGLKDRTGLMEFKYDAA